MTVGSRLGRVRFVWFRALLLGVAVAAAGCAGGTETGNPPIQAKLSYAAYSSEPGVGVREPAATATVASVWLALSDVGFTPGSGCAAEATPRFHAPGIGVGDHASGEPVTTDFTLEPGAYCAVSLPLTLATEPPADAPAALRGASVLVTGTLADGTPFVLRSRTTEAFSLRADTGEFSMATGQSDTLLGFDVAVWLGGTDWSSADSAADGITISAEQNPHLLERFEANLPHGVRLFRDREGDGRLDPELETLARP